MIALITGATAGIGKATAELFAKNGYNIIITGRRKERLEEFSSHLKASYKVDVLTLNFDVRKLSEVEAAVNSIPADWKKINVLVNNAGLAVGLGPIQEGIIDDWERMIDTNIKGLLYITRTLAPLMIQNGFGHIVNIGSIAGKEVYANGNVYCATKHAVDALNKAMRIDMLPHGIKVTGIHPGMVETEFSIVRYKGDEERAKNVYKGLQPLTAEDIADTIYWAASRPAHVNISDVIITPTVQANATNTIRK
ncbi:MAG: SDR family NAD(P)-dependent oxidoreductase [Bacteroidia bacterium]|nr:SDR family NAD(P)-dependent oxidoreductase [Bacteroidia bacterium]MCK6650263.1 SDR family NAD(P)-dependent oxidoreductase [Bacteroidia bacterium]